MSKKPLLYDTIPDFQRVVSLDVSSTATGWAVCYQDKGKFCVERFGVIRPTASWTAERRIRTMIDRLHEDGVIVPCTPPLRVVMEWQSHLRAAGCRNANGLAVLGKAQGSIWQHLIELRVPVDHVSEREWTKVNGWPARKETRARLIRLACPEYDKAVIVNPGLDKGLDIADAIGIGFWRLSRKGSGV